MENTDPFLSEQQLKEMLPSHNSMHYIIVVVVKIREDI